MNGFDLGMQAEMLVQKIKHYLITTMAVTIDEANTEEFYRAFALTLREEIMINWTATAHTFRRNRARTLYYLCMEHMPGRLTGNNITNMNASDLIKLVLKKMNRTLDSVYRNEKDPGLGNGGLGRLASCLMDSLATQQYPALAYGLRYQYGIFEQELWNGIQVERPEAWLLHENPWEFRRDEHSFSVLFSGRPVANVNKKGEEYWDVVDYDEVRALAYDLPVLGFRETPDFNVLTLRIWTTKESPRNFQLQRFNAGLLDQAAENTTLTDVLYPNDNNEMGKRVRLKQEFLLASASIQDIIYQHLRTYPDMSSFADKVRIQINDTHPALVLVELMRILIKQYNFGWHEAWEIAQTCCSYTNHTVLKESLEEWNQNRLHFLLPRQYHIIERLNLEFCNAIRKKFNGDEERVRRMSIIEGGQVKMANLAIYICHHINGVAALHTEILKAHLFKDFYEMYPEKFNNVTNGVTQRRWLLNANPRLAEFVSKRIGRGWLLDFTQMQGLAKFASDPATQKEFLEIKKANKRDLITYLQDSDPIRDSKGNAIAHYTTLDEDALFDIQIKRIHEYKRQLMNALHIIMVYNELKANPQARSTKRMVIFAGKAAPGYDMAKRIVELIYCISRKINNDPDTQNKLKVAFIENYNVSKAEVIIPAADLSEQISTSGMEASGTGNMKLAINGALTIGTEDGANVEMHKQVTDQWWPFGFGKTSLQNEEMRNNKSHNPNDIYMHNPAIKRALDMLRDGTFSTSEQENASFNAIYSNLLEGQNGDMPDRFFVLSDLLNYYETQKKAEDLFSRPNAWAEYAIHNMAAMGAFSTDISIHNYAKLIWDLKPCPIDKDELTRVRDEYSEHDKCRILIKPLQNNASIVKS